MPLRIGPVADLEAVGQRRWLAHAAAVRFAPLAAPRPLAQPHLAGRAEVGRAPADDDPLDRRRRRAGTACPSRVWTRNSSCMLAPLAAGVAVVVDAGAALGKPGLERVDDPLDQRLAVLGLHRARRRERVQLGAVERLVGVDVADPGDPRLGQQERLQRRRAARGQPAERLRGELVGERLDPDAARRGTRSSLVALAAATAWPKRRTSVNSSSEPSSSSKRGRRWRSAVERLVEPRPAEARVASPSGRRPDPRPVVGRAQQQVAGHPQVQRQRHVRPRGRAAGTCRGGPPTRSAAPRCRARRRSGGSGRVSRSSRISAESIRAPGHLRRELAPDRLDLGQLGHAPEAI